MLKAWMQMAPKLRPLFRHAAFSLWQHRLRSVLSIFGIACGVVSFLLMMSMGEGARRETLARIEQMGMKNILIRSADLTPEQQLNASRLGSRGLLLSDVDRLRASVASIDDVAAIRELRIPVFAASHEVNPSVLAVTPNLVSLQNLGLSGGRFIGASDVTERSLVCVLGADLAGALGEDGKIGGILRLESSLYRVIGVLKQSTKKTRKGGMLTARDYDHSVFLPLSSESPVRVNELIIEVRSSDDVRSALPAVKRILDVVHHGADDYQVIVPEQLLQQAEQAESTFNILLGSIGLISLLIGGIGIMNIMLASISERTHEIGIRRALGATRDAILAQFLIEAVLLTLIGGVFGVILGLCGLFIVSGFVGWSFYVTPIGLFLPLVVSGGMGLAFGIYPALKAADMDPVVALRY